MLSLIFVIFLKVMATLYILIAYMCLVIVEVAHAKMQPPLWLKYFWVASTIVAMIGVWCK